MNILLFDMGSFTCRDIREELIKQGNVVESMYYHFPDLYKDTFFEERITLRLNQGCFDAVISVNFFHLLLALAEINAYHIFLGHMIHR